MRGNAILFIVLILFIIEILYGAPFSSVFLQHTGSAAFIMAANNFFDNMNKALLKFEQIGKESYSTVTELPRNSFVFFVNCNIKDYDEAKKISERILKISGAENAINKKLSDTRFRYRKLDELVEKVADVCAQGAWGPNSPNYSMICITRDYTWIKDEENPAHIPDTIEIFCRIFPVPLAQEFSNTDPESGEEKNKYCLVGKFIFYSKSPERCPYTINFLQKVRTLKTCNEIDEEKVQYIKGYTVEGYPDMGCFMAWEDYS